MFLFQCCKSVESNSGYHLIKQTATNRTQQLFYNDLAKIDRKDLFNQKVKLLQIQRSQYDKIFKKYQNSNSQWNDIDFPPSEQSLGKIPSLTVNKWKRISDLLHKPTLFDGLIQPKDVIQGSLGDCYFLSAIAALSEKEQRIKKIFGDQKYNVNGIYKVTMRINGQIKQIMVDDYIPVNNNGEPLFCQPNKNQFWVLILQKAWAKAHGSYANIIAGAPTQVFKAITFAPSQTLIIKQKDENELGKLWKIILQHSKKDRPCCCGTVDDQTIDWENKGLIHGHAYTLIDAFELEQSDNNIVKIIMLRNPWGRTQWSGACSENDKQFWQKVLDSQQKRKIIKSMQKKNDGIFSMKYEDFCQYFNQVNFCLLQQNANYLWQNVYPNGKNGDLYEFTIQNSGTYMFQLHQPTMKSDYGPLQKDYFELCRSTLLVAKIQTQKNYKFIDGVLKYNDQDTTLKVQLQPGKYILYSKLDRSINSKQKPSKSTVSVYSVNFTKLETSEQKKHPDFLKKMFLSHAKLNKRQEHNNGAMWISWKLLYQQGGYAYLAFGNSSQSKKKFIINFNEEQFEKLNFKLKKPFKGKGSNQVLQVLPGQQSIILARVKNIPLTGLKFPPELSIKMQKIDGERSGIQAN